MDNLAYIGLGSNLADPLTQIRRAIAAIAEFSSTQILACSSVYRNGAMVDPLQQSQASQPDYLNTVAAIRTRLGASELLASMLEQESIQGRVRNGRHWAARCIDLDLLLYGEVCMATPTLTLPHPGVHQRPFVIHPLAEIAPHTQIPGIGEAAQVAKLISRQSLIQVCHGSDLLE